MIYSNHSISLYPVATYEVQTRHSGWWFNVGKKTTKCGVSSEELVSAQRVITTYLTLWIRAHHKYTLYTWRCEVTGAASSIVKADITTGP